MIWLLFILVPLVAFFLFFVLKPHRSHLLRRRFRHPIDKDLRKFVDQGLMEANMARRLSDDEAV